MTALTNILKSLASPVESVKSYGIFISHAWDYHSEYLKLVELLYSIKDFRWHNCTDYQYDTIPRDIDAFHDYLPAILNRQIQNAHCMLLVTDLYREHRYWIQKELDIGRILDKPIIALQSRWFFAIPRQILSAAREIVEWNPATIVNAIKRHSQP
jgi:hypothetical protein